MIGDKVISMLARAQKRQARERRALEIERQRQAVEREALIVRQTRELDLRAQWTSMGVSPERQDQLLEEIEGKAAAGAMVGPFQLPHDTQ